MTTTSAILTIGVILILLALWAVAVQLDRIERKVDGTQQMLRNRWVRTRD